MQPSATSGCGLELLWGQPVTTLWIRKMRDFHSTHTHTHTHTRTHTHDIYRYLHKFMHKYILDVKILSNAVLSLENYSFFFCAIAMRSQGGVGNNKKRNALGLLNYHTHACCGHFQNFAARQSSLSLSLPESLSHSDRERKDRWERETARQKLKTAHPVAEGGPTSLASLFSTK